DRFETSGQVDQAQLFVGLPEPVGGRFGDIPEAFLGGGELAAAGIQLVVAGDQLARRAQGVAGDQSDQQRQYQQRAEDNRQQFAQQSAAEGRRRPADNQR